MPNSALNHVPVADRYKLYKAYKDLGYPWRSPEMLEHFGNGGSVSESTATPKPVIKPAQHFPTPSPQNNGNIKELPNSYKFPDKRTSWEKRDDRIDTGKNILSVASGVASMIPSPIQPFAAAVSSGLSASDAVDDYKNGNLLGAAKNAVYAAVPFSMMKAMPNVVNTASVLKAQGDAFLPVVSQAINVAGLAEDMGYPAARKLATVLAGPKKAYGDGDKKSFNDWYKTVPPNKADTSSYNLRRAYELAPQKDLDNFVKDPNAHLYSTYKNKETGIYEFMKSKDHPTIQKELEWFNSNDPEAIKFRNNYKLDTSKDYYQYVPQKHKYGGTQQFGNGGTLPQYPDGGEVKPYQAKDAEDYKYRQKMYQDSSMMYNQYKEMERNREPKYKPISSTTSDSLDSIVNSKPHYNFDETSYKNDAKKGSNNIKSWEDYIYDDNLLATYKRKEKDVQTTDRIYNTEITPKFTTVDPKTLKNGVVRTYDDAYEGRINYGSYSDKYPDGSWRYYYDNKLIFSSNPNIKPIRTDLYGTGKVEKADKITTSSLSTEKINGNPIVVKNKSNNVYQNYYAPMEMIDVYKRPTQKVLPPPTNPPRPSYEKIQPIQTSLNPGNNNRPIEPKPPAPYTNRSAEPNYYTAYNAQRIPAGAKEIGYFNDGDKTPMYSREHLESVFKALNNSKTKKTK